MKTRRVQWRRIGLAAGLVGMGAILVLAGWYQKRGYLDPVATGAKATEEARLDNLDFERAEGNLFAAQDVLAYDRGVRASTAGQFPLAARHFQDVIARSHSPSLRAKAHYNLGNLLALQGKVREAAEMYREALRLDPSDWDAKSNLETLYEVEPSESDGARAALRQAPARDAGSGAGQGGTGPAKSGI